MDDIIVTPLAHAELRRTVLQWALSTAKNGEPQAAIMARAEAYLEFVIFPLRREIATALVERQAANAIN